jgi:hypothetical protein
MKKLNLPKSFHRYLGLWMEHTLFTWYEQENMGYKADFETFPGTLWLLRLLSSKGEPQRRCTSVLQSGTRGRKNPNAALCVRIATAYAEIKECAVDNRMLHDTAFLLFARATCSV